ncbi:DUF6236 family protein [Bradyrhizobium sp. WSM2793]|uniref:DUF6236 family protein n=1 Tax=Bradyrhizobium sp. WSM2793 TaxID=1038866 RepID=UPI0012F82DBB|nr:DUF6236 family protein [Bradyrhizobium sp. WSM2793]
MGEAKRRHKSDPHYGRPIRGLILASAIQHKDGSFSFSGGIDPQDLRHGLLFWDQLVWPDSNYLSADGGPDEKFLEDVKILSRPRYTFTNTMKDAEPIIAAQIQAFKELNGAKRGVWDMCQYSAALLSRSDEAAKEGGIQVELLNAIPVPDKDVPLNEILEFKLKRNDEFLALRTEIDSLVETINLAKDSHAELQRKIAQIDTACADALKISSEWKFPVRLSNQKATFDLKPFEVIAGSLAGYLGGTALGVSSALLAGIGGAVAAAKSSVKISADIGWKGLKPRKTPFAYVAQFNKELF